MNVDEIRETLRKQIDRAKELTLQSQQRNNASDTEYYRGRYQALEYALGLLNSLKEGSDA